MTPRSPLPVQADTGIGWGASREVVATNVLLDMFAALGTSTGTAAPAQVWDCIRLCSGI